MVITKTYELAIVGRGSLTQEAQDKLVSDISANITKLGGKVEPVETLGKRILAFDIAKEKEGYYSFATFTLFPSTIKDLTTKLRTNEALLRFLLINKEEKKKVKKGKDIKA